MVVQMRAYALFGAENFGFSKFTKYPHRQGGGLSQYGHFENKGGRDDFFAILCGRPLWTAPNDT